jgi:hypothetical protein
VICISILIVMKEIPPLKKEKKKKRNLDILHFSNHCDFSIKFSVFKNKNPFTT